jgi:outer membrane protein assembly factor BamA
MGELEAKTYVRRLYFRRSVVYAEVGVKSVDFTRGGLGSDPLLEDAVNAGATPAPPGYERGYTLFRSSVAATLDTRPTGPRPGSGMRLVLGGGHAGELRTHTGFVRYGGSVTGFLDLNDRARVLSLGAGARFTDPTGRGEVPFTEQVTLGGDEPMRGFYEYRLIDRSAFVVDLGYRWPIWMWLDGTMHAEVGNVFGEHLSGFEAGKLRFSGSIGVEDTNPGDHRTQFLLGFGSETFESGGKIDSFRFLFGTTYGF